MSMSEFERQQNNQEDDCSSFFIQRCPFPQDFTEEDRAFAEDLQALFSPEEEDLPPYFVQTLLDMDDQRIAALEAGFEHKTSARVFRRLQLQRRLFSTHTNLFTAFHAGLNDSAMRRSVLKLLAVFLLIMLLTVAFTGESFASGVAILLRGTHGSGVYQADKYPVGIVQGSSANLPDTASSEISLLAAQEQMHFPIYWPEYRLPDFSLKGINLYSEQDQRWIDGPMLEFKYNLSANATTSDNTTKGSGEIWVREFKPEEDVLQLVKQGSSVPIQIDDSGKALAIYVDGQWEWDARDHNVPHWVSGKRSELIYQLNGVLFWIAGDQRDGVGEQELMKIASGLQQIHFTDRSYHIDEQLITVTEMNAKMSGPFSTDVIVLFPDDGGNGPNYISDNPYQPVGKNPHNSTQ